MKIRNVIFLAVISACLNKQKQTYPLNGTYRFVTFIENDTALNFCSPLHINNGKDSMQLRRQDTLNFVFKDSLFTSYLGYKKEALNEAKIIYSLDDKVFVQYKNQPNDTIRFSFSKNGDTVKFKSISRTGITVIARLKEKE